MNPSIFRQEDFGDLRYYATGTSDSNHNSNGYGNNYMNTQSPFEAKMYP